MVWILSYVAIAFVTLGALFSTDAAEDDLAVAFALALVWPAFWLLWIGHGLCRGRQ